MVAFTLLLPTLGPGEQGWPSWPLGRGLRAAWTAAERLVTQVGAATRQLRLRAVGGLRREAMNVAVEGRLGLGAPVTPAVCSPCEGESIRIGVGEAVPGGPSVPRAVGCSHMAVGT